MIRYFGGSGLLSHTVKYAKPTAMVVYNDFDDYRKRIATIPETNILLRKIRKELVLYPRSKRITGQHREAVLRILKEADVAGYVDYITPLDLQL